MTWPSVPDMPDFGDGKGIDLIEAALSYTNPCNGLSCLWRNERAREEIAGRKANPNAYPNNDPPEVVEPCADCKALAALVDVASDLRGNMRGRADLLARHGQTVEALEQMKVLPDNLVCACLSETGERQVRLYERCERCGAFVEADYLSEELARHLKALERLADEDPMMPPDPDGALAYGFHQELAARRKFARAALAADTDSRTPEARLDPRRFSARYSDRVAKIEGGLPMERG